MKILLFTFPFAFIRAIHVFNTFLPSSFVYFSLLRDLRVLRPLRALRALRVL